MFSRKIIVMCSPEYLDIFFLSVNTYGTCAKLQFRPPAEFFSYIVKIKTDIKKKKFIKEYNYF